jgi:endo-1,4-beta-xylanase
MDNPKTEYYIVESYGTYNPGKGFTTPPKEIITVDGGTYHIYWTTRTTAWEVMRQLWSVRQEQRVGGTINVQAHFDAWVRAGAKMGANHTYQILATEGYRYKDFGSASITVTEP